MIYGKTALPDLLVRIFANQYSKGPQRRAKNKKTNFPVLGMSVENEYGVFQASVDMSELATSCIVVDDTSNWSALIAVARSEVTTDWCGGHLEKPFCFSICRDSTHLAYVAEIPKAPTVVSVEHYGRFIANLAEPETGGDTAELFILLGDGSYFEAHITAQGAWWYSDFASYRKRRPERIPAGVGVHVVRGADSWIGVIRLPFVELPVSPGMEVQFQATLALCGGISPVYISSAGAFDFEPDFHNLRGFRRLRL